MESIDTLELLRARAEKHVTRHQRHIERFTSEMGRPRSLYLIVGLVVVWTAYNGLAVSLGLRPFDPPPFAWLQGIVSFAALVVTTTVLITQNRQKHEADERAQLELHVNLLAEQKIAKLIALVEELRRDMPIVHDRVDEVAENMTKPVDPSALLAALEDKPEPSAPTEPPEAPTRR